MASTTILSDNGVSSGSAGLKSSGGNDGVLILQTSTVGGTATNAVYVDTSQNVGVGVTPSAWYSSSKAIQINSGASIEGISAANITYANAYRNSSNVLTYIASDYASRYSQSSGVHSWSTAASGTAGNAISFTQAMTLDASGRLLINQTSAPSFYPATLNITASATAAAAITLSGRSSDNLSDIYFTSNSGATNYAGIEAGSACLSLSHTTGYLSFGTNGSERARIDSSGNLLVGTTSVFGAGGISIQPSAGAPTVDVKGSATTNGSSVFNVYSTGASAYRFYVGMGGTISATSTTITGISDRRLKENIRDLDDGLEKVMALQPRKFDWKEGKGADVKNARGFIAQEFEEVFPDLIEQWKDEPPEGEEPYKAVRADLIPTLVKAIQEQQALITQLQADVAALKGQA